MKISKPIIFLPGTTCDERVWFPCWQHMQHTSRAYVPLQWAETYEQMQALTDDRVTQFDSSVHLVGFSMGGYIAAQYALANPDIISSLTLVGYNPRGLSDEEVTNRKNLIQQIEQKRYRLTQKHSLSQYLHPSRAEDTQLTEYLAQMNEDLGAGVLKAHIQATTPRRSLIEPLATLTMPIHFVAGRDDSIAPLNDIQQLQSRFGHSHLSVVEQAGHMMLVEQPERCAQLIEQQISHFEHSIY